MCCHLFHLFLIQSLPMESMPFQLFTYFVCSITLSMSTFHLYSEEIGKISAFCFNFAKEAVVTIYTCVVFRFSKKKSIDWETTIKSLKTQQLRMVLAASHTLISTSPIEVLFHQVDFSDLLGKIMISIFFNLYFSL